ncbi:YtcA family lipoprotein [Paraburkholderia sp. J67]|uniref:YtcA family lipoprotein n=1 Tax=Paraburkholderia sp. J67 TaxID=2805435 RepID=UPI002ABEA250|nr:YtcA family lipoprotein [Paraburkholderia sp. J67]
MRFLTIKHAERLFRLNKPDGFQPIGNPAGAWLVRRRSAAARVLSTLSLTALAGCSASPSISVLGAFFPDWMFSLVGGLLLTLIVHGVLVHLQRERLLGPPLIVNSALITLFSLLVWLFIFNS